MSFSVQIAELEREIAAVRSHFRDATRNLEVAKAKAEQRAIVAAGGIKALGSNEDERKRALVLALAEDTAYQELVERHADIQHRLERFEADLRGVEAHRRESEWQTRQQLAGTLAAQRITSDQADRSGDGAFDDAALEHSIRVVETIMRADLYDHQRHAANQARQSLAALRSSLIDTEPDLYGPYPDIPF